MVSPPVGKLFVQALFSKIDKPELPATRRFLKVSIALKLSVNGPFGR